MAIAQDPQLPASGIAAPTLQEAAAAAARGLDALPGVPAVTPTANNAAPKTSTAPAAVGVLTPKLQPQSVTIAMINGNTMTGTLSEADQWTMKTSLGTTTLPLSAVAGIKMAQEGNATTTVVLHNGDSITGAVQIDHVAIQTDWGRAEIFGTHVTSIMFVPGLKWTSESGLSGTRWKLINDDSARLGPTVSVDSRTATSTSAAGAPAAGTPAAGAPAASAPAAAPTTAARTTNTSAPQRVGVPIRGGRQ